MSYSNWRCKLNRRVRLIKRMFGFGPKLKTYAGPRDVEDLKKREFLEWHLGLVEGQDCSNSIDYMGNNVWGFNNKEFIILKDMAQRHQPHIQYGKVNDQWVKLKHEGYYVLENQEGD